VTLVSVVVPCYDVAAFLEAAVHRLLRQTHEDLEIVLVDDGSKDGTGDLVRELAQRHPRVVGLSQPNAGVAAARETAVRAARGEHVWFVDADDDWPDEAVAVLLAAAESTGADVVCAAAAYRFPDGRVRPVGEAFSGVLDPGEAFRRFLTGRITGHLWNKLVRRELASSIVFTRSRHHSDQAMVAQLLAGATRVAGVETSVYRYVLRTGSIIRSGTPRSASLETVGAVVRSCAERLGLQDSVEYRYYVARYALLSRLKDATSGAYPPEEAARLTRRIRSEISVGELAALWRRGDRRRFALLAAGRWSPPLYRSVMRRGGARD
jgi:glycosyltransferase involved in cell wall biosynthesis